MKIKLFNPEGIKPDDYRHKYPELERTEEFSELSARALIFVWWYANPTSDLVLDIKDDYDRVAEAMKKSGFNPGKTEKDRMLKLQFDSNMAGAIKKMSDFDPGVRFKSYMMIRNIFDHYESLIRKGPEAFTVIEGKGDNQTTYIDHARYVTTSAKIAEEIPSLLVRMEEGFGIIDITGNEIPDEGVSDSFRDWHRGREHKE